MTFVSGSLEALIVIVSVAILRWKGEVWATAMAYILESIWKGKLDCGEFLTWGLEDSVWIEKYLKPLCMRV